ncbi:MAG: sulfate permease [Firmicutes bacterium]|jgi:MFS superfamily sulfate permease-like transporter|nr:sulfate permease [Bacillota bacterium]
MGANNEEKNTLPDSPDNKTVKINFWNELSGSIGDLGILLPYVLGAINLVGLNPAAIFSCFGLFYIFCGWFYRIPMAVQPMKAASAALLVHNLTAGEMAAAGLIIGASLLILGLTGLIDFIARVTPRSVVSGIQVGLGVSLASLGVKMISTEPLIGWIILVLILLLLRSRRLPAAIIALAAGIALNFILHPDLSLPSISIAFPTPALAWPKLADFNRGFLLAALPQLPLTVANAVLVTTVVSRELYGEQATRVKDRNLCLTMGVANLLSAPLGGYMMCHGSGGVAAHHRFGGRTRYTSYIIGAFLLITGLLLGSDGAKLLALIPEAVLGCLLFYSGLDLAVAAKFTPSRQDLFIILGVAILSIATNPAIAFIAGFFAARSMEKGWIKI